MSMRSCLRSLVVESLPTPALLLVLGAELLRLRCGADLGHRDVPPDPSPRQVTVLLGLHDDHARAPLRPGLAQGLAQLVLGGHAPAPGAEALGILGEVDGEVLALQAIRGGVAPAELVAELAPGAPHLEPPDTLVAVVLREDDRDLELLLERGDQLGRVHEVGAVADE